MWGSWCANRRIFPTFAARNPEAMSKVCQITGKHVITGNRVSHSNRKTRRTFTPNLQDRRFFLPAENRWVTLRVSAAGMRTIDKIGLEAALKQARAKGYCKA
jgi:large subunit ribosomal protein L28